MAGAPTAKPAPFLGPLDTLDRGLLLAESALSFVIVTAIVLVAVAEALVSQFRPEAEWLRVALRAASDLTLAGTLWAAFLGASFATRGRKHLAIDVVGRLLPDRWRRVVVAVSCTLGSVVAYELGRAIYETLLHASHAADEQLHDLQQSGIGAAAVDHGYEFHFVIPVGFYLIGIRLLLHAFHELIAAMRGTAKGDKAPTVTGDADADSSNVRDMVEPVQGPPVAHATIWEVGIAVVGLLAVIVVTAGSTITAPVAVCVVLATAGLGIPVVLRWRRTKSLAPTIAREAVPPAALKATPAQMAVAIVAIVGILISARYGISIIPSVPIGYGIAFFAVMALLGAPLFTFLGGLAMFLWLHGSDTAAAQPLANAVEDVLGNHFARMSVLPTIPIFTLAGYLMSEAKTPQRLVRVARALLGSLPGGLAIVCVLASAFFTIFSGASGITIVAIGGLLLPALLRDKYPERFSMGLVTTGGALGITFYPCLPVIVYGIVAGLQEAPPGHERFELQKFIGAGVVPGLLLIAMLSVFGLIVGIVRKVPRSKFDGREAYAALREAIWELLLPVFLVAGLATGVFSPVQGAAFTVLYVAFIEVFIYKDLSLTRDLPRIVPESMILVGAIFVKLCAATVLMGFFVQAQTADMFFEWLTCGPPAQQYLAAHSDTLVTCREAVDVMAQAGSSAGGIIDDKISFLIALNVFLLIVGMLMDIFSAIVVIVPLITGIALHFGVSPYHLGVVFLLNLEIGYLMPPMGLNLFIAAFRFQRPVPELYRTVLPFIGIFLIALALTTYVPQLSLWMVPSEAAITQPAEPPPLVTPEGEAAGVAPVGEDGGAATGPAADCDAPRDGESFEDFDRRCTITGEPEAPVPTPAPSGGSGTPAPAPPDCDEPRPGESFEDFDHRCQVTGAAAPEAAPAPAPAAAPAAPATAPAAAPAPIPADCNEPRPGEAFDAFDRRCHVTGG